MQEPSLQLAENQKAVLHLLADGEFHSGNELAAALQVSRSAVWKYLQHLPELGIAYSAVNGKGYRLEKPLALLSKADIQQALTSTARKLINKLEIHDSLPSTNTYLNQLALDGAPSGLVCFAEQQTDGKGRRGRRWVSPFGHNIYSSVLWRFQGNPAAISGLSLAVGIAVIRALNARLPEHYGLKWPNDIYCRNKKLGGILIEVTGESEGPSAAIIGIGLNRYLPVQEATRITQDWIDLSEIAGDNAPDRNHLAASLLNHLLPILADYESEGIAAFLPEWRRHDCLAGKPGSLYIGHHAYEGIIQGIDDNGLLLLKRPDGAIQAFASGEVSFRQDAP